MGRWRDLDTFKYNTCDTIDDVTGAKVKLNETSLRWDGVLCTSLNFEPRQPQDFPVFPRPQKVYQDARADSAEPTPTPFDPNDGWGDL